MTGWLGVSTACDRLFGEGLAGDGDLAAVDQAGIEETLGENARAACILVVLGGVLAAGGEVADVRRAVADGVEVVDGEGDVELTRDGEQVQHGVGAASGGAGGGVGVLDGLAGDDLRGAKVVLGEFHHETSGLAAGFGLVGRHGGNAGDLDGGDAEELAGHRHGVGGELAAAGSGAGAGCGFESFELVVVDLSGGVRAHALEDLKDGDLLGGAVGLGELAGSDGAAVEHEAGDIEAAERHDGGGHVLVATGDADEAVEGVAARDELDGVGDDFARDQRGLHALGAHGDAVGDGDGVELHRRAACFAHALLDGLGDLAQVEVARADLGPGVGDADDGLVQVFFAEADAAQVGARSGARWAFGEDFRILLCRIEFVAQEVSLSG